MPLSFGAGSAPHPLNRLPPRLIVVAAGHPDNPPDGHRDPEQLACLTPGTPCLLYTSTVRLQLHAGFTLDDALAQLPYFAALGISHLYLSPITQARAGSTHGYDVIDHGQVLSLIHI